MSERASRAPLVATRLVTLALVLAGVFSVYLIGTTIDGAFRGGREVVVHQTVDADRLGALPDDVVEPQMVPVSLRIRDASTRQLVLSFGRDVPPVVLTIAGLLLLRGLLSSVRDGDPFTAANVRRLRAMGMLLAVGIALGSLLTSGFEQGLAATAPAAGDLATSTDLNLSGLVAGLLLFVLAEVFARGVRMRDDIEGTV